MNDYKKEVLDMVADVLRWIIDVQNNNIVPTEFRNYQHICFSDKEASILQVTTVVAVVNTVLSNITSNLRVKSCDCCERISFVK